MQYDTDSMLLAHLLRAQAGSEAWRHATRKMWQARKDKDEAAAEKWRSVIAALKEIRHGADA